MISNVLLAQKNRIWGVEYALKGGFLLAHTNSMNHLPKQHVIAHEFTFSHLVSGAKSWHKRLSFPIVGVSYYTGNLGNDLVLGKSHGAFGFMKFNLNPNFHRHKFYGKFGVGGTYISKIYSVASNPKNNAISSHWNYLINTSFGYEYMFPGHMYVGFGLDFMHMSNAAYKAPNLGLNIPQIKVNLGFLLQPNKLAVRAIKSDSLFNSTELPLDWSFLVEGIFSEKEISAYPGYKFSVYAGRIYGQHRFSKHLNYETGLDIMYNTSDLALRQEKKIQDSMLVKVGAYLGTALPLDRLQFYTGIGVYLYDPHSLNGVFYQRLGLRYFLLKPLYVNLALKSHWFNADYAEIGVGVRF